MSHCLQEELRGHAVTIIDNRNVGSWPGPELNVDATRIGGDAVVYDVGEGRFKRVAESTQRRQHRRRLGRMDHLPHQRLPRRLSILRTLPGIVT